MKSRVLMGQIAFALLFTTVGLVCGAVRPAHAETDAEPLASSPAVPTQPDPTLTVDSLAQELSGSAVESSDAGIAPAQTSTVVTSETTVAPSPLQVGESVDGHSDAAGLSESLPVLTQATQATPQPSTLLTQPAALNQSRTTSTSALINEMNSTARLGTSAAAPSRSRMAQVTSVSQLSDVLPTDWAYEALRSLVERYDCLEGYPDGGFRGNRPISRYEFAAGLNACLERVSELIDSATNDTDLAQLRRLQEEFAAELATLRGRVDALETRVDEVEANQFSTTTKLFGQVVLGVQDRTDNTFRFFRDEFDDEYNTNIITNVQFTLLTQFSPRSLLITGLQAGNGSTLTDRPALNTFVGLSYEGDTDNDLELSDLTYRHLVGDDLALIVGAVGVNAVNVFRGANRVESAGFGPLSRFAQRNPIVSIGSGDGGVGIDWQLASRISLQAVYSSSLPTDAAEGGLFGGTNNSTAIATQLVVSPFDNLDLSFQYVNSYSPFGRLGTGVGDDQVAVLDGTTFRSPIQTNAFGTAAEWRATRGVTLGGWVGFTTSDLLGKSGTVETLNWMAFLNFPDLFGEGNLGGLYVGQPPRIISSDLPAGRNYPSLVNEGSLTGDGGQPSATTHVELFYRFRVSDNITLTPGLMVIFNPGHNSDNDTITIGALRTTFTF